MLVTLGVLVFLCYARVGESTASTSTLRVTRLESGDVFDNLEAGDEDFCEAVHAECVSLLPSPEPLSPVIGDCSGAAELAPGSECPACRCKNNGSFDAEEFSCRPGSSIGFNCPGRVGFNFMPGCKRRTFPGKQHILVGKVFPCYGRLIEWKFKLPCDPVMTDSWVLLQVWKPVESGFFRAHSNNISLDRLIDTDGSAEYTVSLQEHEQAVVQPGDVIGLYSVLGTAGFPFLYKPIDPPTLNSSPDFVLPSLTTNVPPEFVLESDAIMVPAVIANLDAVVAPLDGVVECYPFADITSIPTSRSDTADDRSGISNLLIVIVSCAALVTIALVGCFGIIAVLIFCGLSKRRTDVTENFDDYTGRVRGLPPLPPPNYEEACHIQDRPNTVYETIPEPTDEHQHFYATLEGPIAGDDESIYSRCRSPDDSNCINNLKEDEEEGTETNVDNPRERISGSGCNPGERISGSGCNPGERISGSGCNPDENAATNIIDPNMEDGSVEEKMKQEADDVVENQQVEEDGYVELHRVSSNESTVRLSIYNV